MATRNTTEVDSAIAALQGQAWHLIGRLKEESYSSVGDQLADMIKVGDHARKIVTLRQAKALIEGIPPKMDGAKRGPKPGQSAPAPRPVTVAATPAPQPAPEPTPDPLAAFASEDPAMDLGGDDL